MANRKVIAIREGASLQAPAAGKARTLTRFAPGASEFPEIEQLKDDIRKMLTDMFKNTPFAQGRLIEMKFEPQNSLTVTVEHKLGGPAKGFIPCGINRVLLDAVIFPAFIMVDPFGETPGTPSVVGTEGQFGKRSDTHIAIVANSPCTAKMWVWR